MHVTVVTPSGSTLPAAGTQLGVGSGSSSASEAETVQLEVQPAELSASAVKDAGTVIVGGVFARTLTEKLIDVADREKAFASFEPCGLSDRLHWTVNVCVPAVVGARRTTWLETLPAYEGTGSGQPWPSAPHGIDRGVSVAVEMLTMAPSNGTMPPLPVRITDWFGSMCCRPAQMTANRTSADTLPPGAASPRK